MTSTEPGASIGPWQMPTDPRRKASLRDGAVRRASAALAHTARVQPPVSADRNGDAATPVTVLAMDLPEDEPASDLRQHLAEAGVRLSVLTAIARAQFPPVEQLRDQLCAVEQKFPLDASPASVQRRTAPKMPAPAARVEPPVRRGT